MSQDHFTFVLQVAPNSSQPIRGQATSDVSEMGTEELVEDDLQVSALWYDARGLMPIVNDLRGLARGCCILLPETSDITTIATRHDR